MADKNVDNIVNNLLDDTDREYIKLSEKAIKKHNEGGKLDDSDQKRYDEVKNKMSEKAKKNPQ